MLILIESYQFDEYVGITVTVAFLLKHQYLTMEMGGRVEGCGGIWCSRKK